MTQHFMWGSSKIIWISLFILGLYFKECEASSLWNNVDFLLANQLRIKRDTCVADQFQCKTTGECISVEIVCDGREDCRDGSDEFQVLCKPRWCPSYLFRCKYGACIDRNKKCNGIEDCKDASDEENCPVKITNKSESNCTSDEFECQDGQCISLDYKCDGVIQCEDKSDETRDLCLNTYCPRYLVRCSYGACVDGNSKCNGVKDCLDGSDELDCAGTTTTTRPVAPTVPGQPPSEGCITPRQPSYGKWEFASGGRVATSGISVPSSTVITFSCDTGYQLIVKGYERNDKAYSYCDVGKEWTIKEMPQCHRLCRANYDTTTTFLKCKDLDTGTTIPCNRATENTTMTYTCAPYYEPPFQDSLTRYCSQGTWSLDAPKCVKVCGEKRVTTETLIVSGQNATKGHYPWVTAIYRLENGTYQNICGGSILKEDIVITAAHCVTDGDGEKLDPSIYIIAAGKYFNKYKDPRDTKVQYAEVASFVVHNLYKANTHNYIGDIAVVVLKKPFALSAVVQPVCLNIDNFQLTYNTQGVVTGWGFTEASGKPSEVLKELVLPYRNENECRKEFPVDYADRYFSGDKLCAGYFKNGSSVCKGDSGGGLVFPDYRKRFNLLGIVSIGPTVDRSGCNIQQSALFTKVFDYLEWVHRIASRNSNVV